MADPAIIDPDAIENLRALNPADGDAFVREIVGIFLEDTPLRLAELDHSLVAGDVTKFARAAHSIKGSAANLGAALLLAAADKLEREARTVGLANVAPLVATLKAEFARAQTALAAMLPK
jgi:histidine phosphotransfer protein HptB